MILIAGKELDFLAEHRSQIAERGQALEAQAKGDRREFLRLLRSDPTLETLRLEHDIIRELLPPDVRDTQPLYCDDAYLRRFGLGPQ